MGNIPTLAVNEIFGVTFQGEGMNVGMPCMFLRLAGCNLACVWCDTPYSWDWKRFDKSKEVKKYSVDMLYDLLSTSPIKNLVITGGEPMLQQKALGALTERLHRDGWHTEIETAGTIEPTSLQLVKHWTVSPKLENSGNVLSKRYKPKALQNIAQSESNCFKFVVSDMGDFDEIDEMVKDNGLKNVWIMPEGVTTEQIARNREQIAQAAIERGYWFTSRLHVELYGQRRAV